MIYNYEVELTTGERVTFHIKDAIWPYNGIDNLPVRFLIRKHQGNEFTVDVDFIPGGTSTRNAIYDIVKVYYGCNVKRILNVSRETI